VLHGDFKVPVVDLRKAAPSLGVQLPAAREASTFGRFSATGGYRLTRKALALTALDWQLDDTRARGRLAVTDLDRMSLTFDLDVDHIDVDRYLAPVPPAVEGAGRPAAPPTPIPLAALRKLVARGELRIGQAKFKDLPLSAVRVPLDADRGLVRIGPAQARLLGGVYAGTTTLDARPAEARLSLDAHVRDIDLGALVKASFKSERFTGHGDANAKLTALGNTDAALFKSIAGRVDANARDGALVGRDLWYEIRRARALSRGAAPPEKTGPDRTQFRAMSGSATIADGIARSDDLTVDLQYLRAHGTGTLVIASQAIDYRLTAEVYNIPPEGSPGAEMADLKALAIPLTVTGTLSDYKVRPDFAGLVKAKVQQQVEAKKQELRQKAEEQIKDKLKGLFGG
jgi:AsmA protein